MRTLTLALFILALLVTGTVALVVRSAGSDSFQPTAAPTAPGSGAAHRPPAPATDAASALPPVEPVAFLPVSRDDARAMNAAVPFSHQPNPAAAPLRLTLPAPDQARAVDCLAAAVWYEAGDDPVGEQAVAQVVLNRLRHPAFPKSVCAVVFQGAERVTGCQFSFTCDGALARAPAPVAWSRAQGIAVAALGGLVYAPVGYATHYHTDWVVPNWSSSVEKIAAVHTHLFFRWRGGTGKPAAFSGVHSGTEPVVAKLAARSPAHAGRVGIGGDVGTLLRDDTVALPATRPSAPADPGRPAASLRGNALARNDMRTGLFVIGIAADTPPGSLALVALDLCRARNGKACTVVGFVGSPAAVITDGVRTRWPEKAPDFYYFSDPSRGRETVYWNCTRFPRPERQCLPPDFIATG